MQQVKSKKKWNKEKMKSERNGDALKACNTKKVQNLEGQERLNQKVMGS